MAQLNKDQRPEEYNNIHVDFDEDTGFPLPETLSIDDVAANQQAISAGNHLAELESSVGWGILMGFLGEEVNSLLLLLRKETNFEAVRRLQCMIEALETIPKIVDRLKISAKQASTLLASYTMTGTVGE